MAWIQRVEIAVEEKSNSAHFSNRTHSLVLRSPNMAFGFGRTKNEQEARRRNDVSRSLFLSVPRTKVESARSYDVLHRIVAQWNDWTRRRRRDLQVESPGRILRSRAAPSSTHACSVPWSIHKTSHPATDTTLRMTIPTHAKWSRKSFFDE
jgi:hypothetical protein